MYLVAILSVLLSGYKFGYVTLYTDAQHLDATLDSVLELVAKTGMPLEHAGRAAVVVEFKHLDCPAVKRWMRTHPSRLVHIAKEKTKYGSAFTLAH